MGCRVSIKLNATCNLLSLATKLTPKATYYDNNDDRSSQVPTQCRQVSLCHLFSASIKMLWLLRCHCLPPGRHTVLHSKQPSEDSAALEQGVPACVAGDSDEGPHQISLHLREAGTRSHRQTGMTKCRTLSRPIEDGGQ